MELEQQRKGQKVKKWWYRVEVEHKGRHEFRIVTYSAKSWTAGAKELYTKLTDAGVDVINFATVPIKDRD